MRWLREQSDWLLIFDDIENPAHLDPFLPGTARGHILLTSRASAFSGLARSIVLIKMTDEIGALFFVRRIERLAPIDLLAKASAEDLGGALLITRELDGLPLALEQAGAYIQSMDCTLASYHILLQKLSALLLEQDMIGCRPSILRLWQQRGHFRLGRPRRRNQLVLNCSQPWPFSILKPSRKRSSPRDMCIWANSLDHRQPIPCCGIA